MPKSKKITAAATVIETPSVEDQLASAEAALNAVQPNAGESVSVEAPSAPAVIEASFAELMATVDQNDLDLGAKTIAKSFDDRIAFEEAVSLKPESIVPKLNAARGKLTQASIVAALIAAEVNGDFVNRQINAGKRYNVYAVEKLVDLAQALVTGQIRNAINNAVVRSMANFQKDGRAFTGEHAKMAASKQIRVSGPEAQLLVRHTVAPVTAPTQASSTMNALETMGIAKNVGTAKHPVYQLTDTAQTKRLLATLA